MNLRVQLFPGDFQHRGCVNLVPVASLQSPPDKVALNLGKSAEAKCATR
jgi:hypothetical protein